MTIEDAITYLNYCVREGCLDEDRINGKTDQELIEMAENMADSADAAYKNYKEDHEN